MAAEPTVGRIAGQLGYLFEEHPELKDASSAELADRLDAEDRAARARSEYPLASDTEIATRAGALDRRVTETIVEEARRRLPDND